MKTSTQIVAQARALIGASGWSGWCEKFTRTCFGFSARYASARLAYEASKRDGTIHTDTNPPPGVPVFWDITSGKNAAYDHVAVSIGGGRVISTSVGKNGTPAEISITALTKLWGMRYLGWGDHYHGKRVHTANDLRRGSKGARVGALQRGLLRVFPAYANKLGRLAADEDFGPQSEEWVREFQERTGLLVDGIVGPATTRELAKYGITL